MVSHLLLLLLLLLLLAMISSFNLSHTVMGMIDREVFNPTRVTQISSKPRAFLYTGFLSDQECAHLIKLAKSKLKQSTVLDSDTGVGVLSSSRTSSGMFLNMHQDDIVRGIESRIATWTFLPEENGESIQILRYENGQKYNPHYDYLDNLTNVPFGGHRVATVIMYLSDVEKGGETVFPIAEGKYYQKKDTSWSDCARNGYAVKPRKGDALLFFTFHNNATMDPYSLHESCPVIEGEKWSATKWIHVSAFGKPPKPPRIEGCLDENVLCSSWAALGECVKNSPYMVGSQGSPGFCRKSCGVCKSLV